MIKKTSFLLILVALPYILFSQSNGDVLNTFGTLEGTDDQVHAVHTSEDGSSFISGDFTHFKGGEFGNLVKLTPSGEIDYSFDASQNDYSGRILVIKEMSNGNVLVGTSASNNFYGLGGLYMLNPDGSIHEDFDVGHGFDNDVVDIALQEDGKIIVVGKFTKLNQHPTNDVVSLNHVVRLNQNGSIDNSFNFGTVLTNIYYNPIVETVKIDRFGRILIGGSFAGSLIRLNSNGSVQKVFKPTTGRGLTYRTEINGDDYYMHGWVTDIVITDNDEIIAVGSFTAYGDETYGLQNIVRFSESGSFDSNFLNGVAFPIGVSHIEKLGDSYYFLAGNFESFQGIPVGKACILDLDGNLNTSFNNGSLYDNYVRDVSVNSSGFITAGGVFENYNDQYVGHFTKFAMTGVNQFNGNGFNGNVYGSKRIEDDIFIFGEFTHYNQQQVNGLVKFNSQGVWDEDFSVGTNFNNKVSDIVRLPNGDLVAVGLFTTYNGSTTNRIVKLNTNGDIDENFQNIEGFDDDVYNITLIEGENTLLVSGKFTSFNNIETKSIIKLNVDGTITSDFNPNFNPLWVNKLVPFGSEFLVGTESGIKLINGTGEENLDFNTINSFPNDIKISPENKIVVAGEQSGSPYIRQYNSDGTIDDSFLFFSTRSNPNYPVGSYSYRNYKASINSLSIDQYGNIYAGGKFDWYEDRQTWEKIPQNNFIVLNKNGLKVDGSSIGKGFDSDRYSINSSIVYTTALFDNNIFVGGSFTQYNNTASSFLVSLFFDGQSLVDTTLPVITLLGENPVNIEVGKTYTDDGATSTDNYDGDITSSIVVTGTVDTDTLGTYVLSYNVSDSSSNDGVTVTRTVNVVETLSYENYILSQFKVFPNPSEDYINIVSPFTVLNIDIYDINGKSVLKSKENNKELIINISKLKTGIYMILINKNHKFKIIKK